MGSTSGGRGEQSSSRLCPLRAGQTPVFSPAVTQAAALAQGESRERERGDKTSGQPGCFFVLAKAEAGRHGGFQGSVAAAAAGLLDAWPGVGTADGFCLQFLFLKHFVLCYLLHLAAIV